MDMQREVGEWHRARFPGCHPDRLRAKLVEEVEELSYAIFVDGYDASPGTADELADVAIVLLALADRCGVDINAAVDAKFKVVKQKYGAEPS